MEELLELATALRAPQASTGLDITWLHKLPLGRVAGVRCRFQAKPAIQPDSPNSNRLAVDSKQGLVLRMHQTRSR